MKLLKIGALIFAFLVIFSIILATCSPAEAYAPQNIAPSEDLRWTFGVWNWDQNVVYEMTDYATAGRAQTECWEFDLNTRTWTNLASYPISAYMLSGGCSFYYGGYVYVARLATYANLWRYNVSGNTWQMYPALPVGMSSPVIWYDWGARQTYDNEGNRITVYDDRVCIADKTTGTPSIYYYRDKDDFTSDWSSSSTGALYWSTNATGQGANGQAMLDATGTRWVWTNSQQYGTDTSQGPGFYWDIQSNAGSLLIETGKGSRYGWGPMFNYAGRYFQWQNGSQTDTFSNCDLYCYDMAGGSWYLFSAGIPTGTNLSPLQVGNKSWGWYDAAHESWIWGAPTSVGDTLLWEVDMSGVFNALEIEDSRIIEIPENDLVVSGSPGGVVTGINWESPRYSYADEELVFSVSGDVNEPVDWYLVNEDGDVLDSGSNVIRADGIYFVVAEVPLATEGFVYVYELGSGVRSLWGYVAPAPDAVDFQTTWAGEPGTTGVTLINPTTVGRFNWFLDALYDVVSIPVSFDIVEDWGKGSIVNSLTVDDYDEICFPTYSGTANFALSYNRYVLCRFDAGITDENYDGLILDLDIPWDAQSRGLYTLEVANSTGNFVADSQSAYAYGDESASGEAVSIVLDKSTYVPLSAIKGVVSINAASGLLDSFDQMTLRILAVDVAGMDVDTEISVGDVMDVSTLTTNFTFTAPAQNGDYRIVVEFSSISGDQTMEVDKAFAVGSGGGGGGEESNPFQGISGTLESWGVGGAVGHWILVILSMVLLTVFAMFVGGQHRGLLACILDLAAVALFLMAGWIAWWLVILLAIGVGVWLVRRVTPQGGGA